MSYRGVEENNVPLLTQIDGELMYDDIIEFPFLEFANIPISEEENELNQLIVPIKYQ